MLTKLLQDLLRVNVFRKGILCLLGCSVAALKVSNLDREKKTGYMAFKKRKEKWIVVL